MLMPSISIVTICKNAGATIERTLASIAQCDYPHLQYIVVDGASTDDTPEHIERYRSHIDIYISEPDGGISDALNKAVALTDGAYHLVIHADDALIPDCLTKMVRLARNPAAQVICGSVSVIDDGRVSRKFTSEPGKLRSKMSVPHMGSLIKKEAWASVGRYDVSRKIAMDHLLMLRILNRFGLSAFSVVDIVVANYFLGGVSDRQIDQGFRELRDNLLEEGGGPFRANAAYAVLLLKSRIARVLGRR
jgi:glycosyltransferase involved in cell wall biosynthesis